MSLVFRALPDIRRSRELMFTGSPPFLLHLVAPLNLLLRRKLTYRITDFFPEALGEDQRRRLLEMGIPAEKIVLRRDTSPLEVAPDTPPAPRPAALAGRKILLYSRSPPPAGTRAGSTRS